MLNLYRYFVEQAELRLSKAEIDKINVVLDKLLKLLDKGGPRIAMYLGPNLPKSVKVKLNKELKRLGKKELR